MVHHVFTIYEDLFYFVCMCMEDFFHMAKTVLGQKIHAVAWKKNKFKYPIYRGYEPLPRG
jgi:hypothetical protein